MGNDMMEAYLYEMNTLLEQVDEIVLSAEKNGSFSEDEVNEIFRIMHTFKGSSAMMEFNSLMTVAHRVEDLFFIIRDKTMEVIPEGLRPELFDLIFQAIDFFRGEVEKIENDQPVTDDIAALLEKVGSFQAKIEQKEDGGEPEAAAEAAAESGGAGASEFGSAEFPFAVQVFFDEGCGMENLRAFMLVNSIRELGAGAFDCLPGDVDTNPESAAFIVENGFILRFASADARTAAMPIIT
ncbi:chemotaxis protein CheA, partial [Butyricicoccus sp. 1XD8-22]